MFKLKLKIFILTNMQTLSDEVYEYYLKIWLSTTPETA